MSQEKWAIHWFRRDLRVQGNPGLRTLFKEFGPRALGVFFLDPELLARSDFSPNRFAFFLKTLRKLASDLEETGSELLILEKGPDAGWERILEQTLFHPGKITWGRDYEPFSRTRDARIEAWAGSKKISVETFRDHLIIEPGELEKPGGGYYQVYTPFSKRWFEQFNDHPIPEEQVAIKRELPKNLFKLRWPQVLNPGSDISPASEVLDQYERANAAKVTMATEHFPEAGFTAALQQLKKFVPNKEKYADTRDFPSIRGTSRLSVYFKNGSITPAQAVAQLGLRKDLAIVQGKLTASQYFKEIVWREFYYQILWNKPSVEHTAFQEKYANLKWENREDRFEAWCEGRTGYPIVDAGMRELKTTGWMHNRVRMIVASFLTKDLLIDWRWGEKHFMNHLLDGDLAPNNGGWQWAASTGCDPQPYFRIFNPKLQSEKFDLNGEYIKRFVPELAQLPYTQIHAPWESGAVPKGYPQPIVDHATQKIAAIALFHR